MSDKIVSVFGTKGGIGKTNIAVGIALNFAERNNKVLLLELDSNFSISTMFNIEKNVTLYDVVFGTSSELNFKKVENVDVLSSDGRTVIVENKFEKCEVQLDSLWKLISNYDITVVDHHNSFSPLTNIILSKSKISIVPLTPDKLSLGAYLHTHKVLESLKIPHKGVANRVKFGFFGPNKDDLKIITKAREKGEMFKTMLPEIKKIRNSCLYHDVKFKTKIRELCDEIKEVIKDANN